ncbi:MAG: MAE_28990/MAE_18760 family HEPN-like nuclease [Thermodesulfobacteriota bacterium]|nr:MAE_28990/MAE_18760 family HEPN-like nuclease [Thermodesulfobacteriota bacterium]
MSIRTIDDLSDKLARELIWRKKELSDLKYYIGLTPPDSTRQKVLGRCGVAILYAHWEGFVKLAGRYFLEFITMQRLRNEELHPNLLTLFMRKQVNFAPNTLKTSEFGKITNFFLSQMPGRADIPYKTAIETSSNLSSAVLREITWCLGLDYTPYETREKFIDFRLLGRRNFVAHGEAMDVDPSEYDEMRTSVIAMMTNLKTQIENSAVLKTYVKPSL